MTKLHVAGAAMALALGFGGSALAEDTGREGSQQGQEQGAYEQQGAQGSPSGQQSPQSEHGMAEEEGARQQQQEQGAAGQTSPGQQGTAGEATPERQPEQVVEARTWSVDELSKEQVMELQRELQSRGHYQGNIDGIAGPMTRAGLRDFQQREDLGGEGQLNQETASALGIELGERQPVAGKEIPSGEEGMAAEGAKPEAMKSFQLSRLSKEQVKELQTKLKESGHYKAKVDGIVGPQTKSALQAYFRRQGELASRGMVSEGELATFGLDADEIERVGGEERQGEPEMQKPEQQGQEGWSEEQKEQYREQQQQREQEPEQERQQEPEQERQQEPGGTGTEPPSQTP